jgi:hypothetical protein
MKEYKSQSKRLVRIFRKSRDNWKETALSRHKKLRALEIKIRDLTASRENWKQRAMKAEKELKLLGKKVAEGEKKGKNFQNQS